MSWFLTQQVLAGISNSGPYLGQVSQGLRDPDTLNATNFQMICRGRLIIRSTTEGNLRIAFPTAYYINNNNGIESGIGADTTIGATICIGGINSANAISGGGSLINITWGGNALATVPSGTLDYLSDEIPGTSGLTPGTVIWYQVRFENPNGILYETGATNYEALNSTNVALGGEQIRYAASGLDLTQISTKSAWTGGTSSTNLRYCPSLVVAQTSAPSVLNIGTSISDGFRSSARTTPTAPAASGELGDRGIFMRALGRSIACASVAQGGSALVQFLDPAKRSIRMTKAPYFSHIVTDHGTNDLRGQNRTVSELIADYTAFSALFPGKPVFIGTILPDVTGSAGVTNPDGSDQTPNTSNGFNTKQPAANALIRAGVSGVAGYFDLCSAVQLTGNEQKWYADGTALLMTPDFLHPSTYAEQRIVSSGVVDTSVFVR